MKSLLLPPDAVNIEDESAVTEFSFSRLVRILLENDGILGSTDRAFYYIYPDGKRYYSTSVLFRLLTYSHLSSVPLISLLTKRLRESSRSVKPSIFFSLLSEDLPRFVFFYDNEISSIDDLINVMDDFVRNSGIVETVNECRKIRIDGKEKREVVRALFSTIIDVAEFLKVKYDLGFIEEGRDVRPCVVLNNVKYKINRNLFTTF